ncbi:sugar ABC transporter substrate-binding protein [Streptomyces sp. H10-C2]|uniref:ABC transporter substrate-binding protein n=1 Tax=unclassified Streptomyces TaxID=2593676 RepID=UPI0024B883CA|nr:MULTISPECIES: sugar ABC transporter substrate-binding protein [unclassified Streptomyces]MDJ0340794.1 sugar ABC transporter substrate-binding protein [Streptomyces sp. PH10-H1]MDJ0371634.1 sugar ABC transporter substrate-binding protein [Streptomyces sp. H10-C2]
MRTYHRAVAATAIAAAMALTASACGGGTSSSDSGGNTSPKTLTYWASNQGTSLENDKQVLEPELKKFEQQTGIKVKLEVVPWSDLLNRILAAATSGQGPDVLNIGNTWSASLQATGALLPFDAATFAKIGGKDRFVSAALAAAGAQGKDPAAVPLYSLAYGLYYNKKMFADAGIAAPPTTWDELVADGKKLTKGGKFGLAVEGGNGSENIHHAFVLGKQHGSDFFDASGKATFDTPENVAAVKQYIDFIGKDKIAAPGNAEYSANQSLTDFATGKAGMLMWQAAASSLKSHGMKPEDYGVAPVPFQTAAATGATAVNSMVAGINLAVFKNSKNLDGSLKFVNFMTSPAEQKILNATYGSLPPVKEAQSDPAFATPDLKTLADVLAKSAAPLPQVPNESQFETLVGTAMKELFAQAASGKDVTTENVKAALTKAQQQMPAA